MEYLCECEDPACRETIPLEREEWEFLRRQPGCMVIPGHQEPTDEIIGGDSDGRFIYVADTADDRVSSDPHVEVPAIIH